MPKHAHRLEQVHRLTEREELLLTVVLREINLVRQALHEPPRTRQDVQQAIRAYLHAEHGKGS